MASWVLKADAESKSEILAWLDEEATMGYVLISGDKTVQVDFLSFDDAFRFRMRFDAPLLNAA